MAAPGGEPDTITIDDALAVVVKRAQERRAALRPSQQSIESARYLFDIVTNLGYTVDKVGLAMFGNITITLRGMEDPLMQGGESKDATGFVPSGWSMYGKRGSLAVDATPAEVQAFLA